MKLYECIIVLSTQQCAGTMKLRFRGRFIYGSKEEAGSDGKKYQKY